MNNYLIERNKIIDLFIEGAHKTQFESCALQIFQFQYHYNSVYRQFCNAIGKNPGNTYTTQDLVFLPIQMFKQYPVKTGSWKEKLIFRSSGTTAMTKSEHYVKDPDFYLKIAESGFVSQYGSLEDCCILAILPGYQERKDSSLIYMVDHLIQQSEISNSGYYLNQEESLFEILEFNKQKEIKTIVFGVSFALLKLAERTLYFPDLILIETGGMKDLSKELSKEEIYSHIQKNWTVKRIDSEYGMTELFSQSYAKDDLWFAPIDTKQVHIGQLSDPFASERHYKAGIIRIIDLANFDTCSFIETQDLGMSNEHGNFQVLGRMDTAEIRGCNLLLSDI